MAPFRGTNPQKIVLKGTTDQDVEVDVLVTADGKFVVDTEINATLDPSGLATAAAAGANTDAAASVSEDETGTARTHTSVLKAAKNLLIDISGYLSTLAGAVTSSKVQVDVKSTVSTAVTGPLTSAELITDIGALTDSPASVSVDEDGTARSIISLLKGAKNLLIDISGFLSALKFGDQNKAASLSVTPGTDIPTTRDIGRVTQAGFSYKGADRKTMAGAAQESTIASGAKCAVVAAEGGDIRFTINGDATSISAGYIIAGGQAIALLVAATKLSVYGPIGAYANIMYYG